MPTKAMLRIHGAFLGALLFVAACTSESLDVGETDVGETDAGAPTAPEGQGGVGGYGGKGAVSAGVGGVIYTTLPSWPAPTDCVASSNLDIVGVWEGAIRDFDFEPLVPLRLQILGASEEGGVCGTLRWGVGSPPPPPSDPDQTYPPGFDPEAGGWPRGPFYEGAFYTLMQGGVSGDRLHFGITTTELWKDWCALQTPYFHPDSMRYQCVPFYDAENPPPDPRCDAQCRLCGAFSTCICSPDDCTADPTYAEVAFDLGVDSNQIQGNLVANSSLFDGIDPRMTDVFLTWVE